MITLYIQLVIITHEQNVSYELESLKAIRYKLVDLSADLYSNSIIKSQSCAVNPLSLHGIASQI